MKRSLLGGWASGQSRHRRSRRIDANGAEITPDNARFFAAPLPVVLHIISVTIYCVLGAFQSPPGLPPAQTHLARRRRGGF